MRLQPAPRPAAPGAARRPPAHAGPRPAVWLALLAGALFLLWLRLHQPPNTVDDAYITFRYARNLAAGAGFVYNPGERVLGTTTPAYAALLAVAAALSGAHDYPWLAMLANALGDALSFALLYRLVARLTGRAWLGVAAAWLLAVEGRLLDFSTGGMEGSFNVAAILATLVLFFEGRRRLAALAAGLVVLIRPDGAMLAAALFAGWGLPVWRRPRQWPWREAGLFLAVVLPWVIFATLYFGQPIPQSVLAKSEVYRLPAWVALRAFLVQLRTILPFSLPPLRDPEPLGRQLAQAALPAALVAGGLWAAQRRHPRAWVLGLYLALFMAFFTAGNPLWLGWYEIPLMPLYWALILAGLGWLWAAVKPRLPAGPARGGVAGLGLAAVAGLLALPHLSRLNLAPWERPQNAAFTLNATYNKRREADYRLLAEMLAPAAAQGRLVAIPEVGAFGYAYPGKVFDTTGLISPPVLRYFPIAPEIPVEIYSVPRAMILDLQPDLFISFDSFLQATLPPDDPAFTARYAPAIGLTSHAAFGVQRLVAYRRADRPVEVALPPAAQPLEAHFGPVALAGYSLAQWQDTDYHYLEATLYWRGPERPPETDLVARVDLLDADGQPVFQIINYLGEGLFPGAGWGSGMWLVDRYPLKRPVPDRGPYGVAIAVFAADADVPLPATDARGQPLPDDTLVIDGPRPGQP